MKKTFLLSSFATASVGISNAALVGLWQFENDYTDSSGTGNDGAAVGSVPFVPGQAGYGQAGSFGGANYVQVPHSTTLDAPTGVTIAAWVNATGNQWEGILAKNPSDGSLSNHAGNYELRLENATQNMTFLYQRGATNDTHPVGSGVPVSSNSWNHVAVTMDGVSVRFYLNGVLATTVAGLPGFGATNTSPLYIGNRADFFTSFDGLLDDVAVFDEVLTDQQIATIRTGDFSAFVVPEPSGLGLLGLALLVPAFRRRR